MNRQTAETDRSMRSPMLHCTKWRAWHTASGSSIFRLQSQLTQLK
jgi:hypothetical protein